MCKMNVKFTLHAVSNPKLVGTSLHFKSPSMVFGHPITRVFIFLTLKWINERNKKYSWKDLHMITHKIMYANSLHNLEKLAQTLELYLFCKNKLYLKVCARKQALVFESSPPMTTSPSKSSFFAVPSACLNWNSSFHQLNSHISKKSYMVDKSMKTSSWMKQLRKFQEPLN